MAQFDNPVLQAYVQGVSMRRENEARLFKQKLDEEASKRAETQLKLYGEHLKTQEAAENARLDMQRTQLALEKQSKELEARQHIADMLGKGTMSVRPQTMGEANSSPMGGTLGGIDPRTISYATPEQILANDLNRARAMGGVQAETAGKVTTATETAKAPFEQASDIRKFSQQKELSVMGATQRKELQDLEGKQKLEQIEKTIEGQKTIARIHGQYGLDEARIRSVAGNMGPEEWAGTVASYATGENAKPLGNTAKDLLIKQHMRSAGLQEFSGTQAQKLRDMHMLDPVTGKMQEFMAKLPSDKINAAGEKVVSKIPVSDLNNLAKLISARAGHVAQTIGGEGSRLTEDDIRRALGAMIVPGITINQAKERMDLYMADLNNRVSNIILGGYSPKQKLLILKRYDFDPKNFNQVIEHGGKKDYLYKQAADGEWGYFDKKSGQYKGMDE
jgi:hypothetical protein